MTLILLFFLELHICFKQGSVQFVHSVKNCVNVCTHHDAVFVFPFRRVHFCRLHRVKEINQSFSAKPFGYLVHFLNRHHTLGRHCKFVSWFVGNLRKKEIVDIN